MYRNVRKRWSQYVGPTNPLKAQLFPRTSNKVINNKEGQPREKQRKEDRDASSGKTNIYYTSLEEEGWESVLIRW